MAYLLIARIGDLADLLLGRRVDHRQALAGLAGDQPALDEELAGQALEVVQGCHVVASHAGVAAGV